MADIFSVDNFNEHPEVEQVCRNSMRRQQIAERISFVIIVISVASAMLLV